MPLGGAVRHRLGGGAPVKSSQKVVCVFLVFIKTFVVTAVLSQPMPFFCCVYNGDQHLEYGTLCVVNVLLKSGSTHRGQARSRTWRHRDDPQRLPPGLQMQIILANFFLEARSIVNFLQVQRGQLW